ncbi:MAG: hypothetical protein AABM30_05960 [Actinomycetota bacterium]
MRPRREADRRRALRTWALRGALLLIVFAVGLALGQALDDSAPPAGTRTSVRTLTPGTLSPETVTVTVGTAP